MSTAVTGFTLDTLDWEPWIATVDPEAATPEQRDALRITPSNTKLSAYVLALAHDPEALRERSPLFNAVMYAPRGLPRAERELATLAESVLNGCIYCASVHARRFAELTREPEIVHRFYDEGLDAPLDPRRRAIVDFAVALSHTPSEAGPRHLDALRAAGLADLEIFDLVASVAMFAWANRLMLTLGEPVRPDPAA